MTNERTEPIAADMRPQGDGATRARFKLLAGLLGVNFDELWHRERRRRIRKVARRHLYCSVSDNHRNRCLGVGIEGAAPPHLDCPPHRTRQERTESGTSIASVGVFCKGANRGRKN